MGEEVYLRLREFLDGFPLGFPKTDSGVEIEILKRLFTPEEASVALLLSPFPESAREIADRAGIPAEGLGERLDAMSRKGLVFRIAREDRTLFNAAPYMIGLYEYSVRKMDGELARLFEEYYEKAYQGEMAKSNVPGFKVLPVSENINAGVSLFPYETLEKQIREEKTIALAECICRKESMLTLHGCDYPLETCLSFGVAARYYIENGMGREISADEAVKVLHEADKAGLVHASVNTAHLSNICNCCPCCCASMKGITKKGHDRHRYMNALFEAGVDSGLCAACGDCVQRCPVKAMSLEESARVNTDVCLGCGLCAGVCPTGAISLTLKPGREAPFNRVLDLGAAILAAKQRQNRA
jgi:electron transport complex protein RnfB